MATVGHLCVGVAAGLVTRPRGTMSRPAWRALLAAVALAPDADVVAFPLGIPYEAAFGHRGATHSVARCFLPRRRAS